MWYSYHMMHYHSSIIDALGGTAITAAACGVPSQYVSKWRRRGVPSKYFTPLVALAKERAVALSYEDLLEDAA